MEQDASAFAAAVQDAATTDKLPTHAIQQLKGNFRFLWGMYKAHSEVGQMKIYFAARCQLWCCQIRYTLFGNDGHRVARCKVPSCVGTYQGP